MQNELGPWKQAGLCLDLDGFVQWQRDLSFSFRGLSVLKCGYLFSPQSSERLKGKQIVKLVTELSQGPVSIAPGSFVQLSAELLLPQPACSGPSSWLSVDCSTSI